MISQMKKEKLKELKLENGGVFAGNKAGVTSTPTIVIDLGGTWSKNIEYVKRKVWQKIWGVSSGKLNTA